MESQTHTRNSEDGNAYSPTGREILTLSGRLIDLADVRPSDIDIRDIAWGLAGTRRFAAQHPRRITVAQHSLAVMEIVRASGFDFGHAHIRRAALLHDAAEAYIGDQTSAAKLALRYYKARARSPYDDLEERIQAAVDIAFRSPSCVVAVQNADRIACQYELSLGGWHDVAPGPAKDMCSFIDKVYDSAVGGFSEYLDAAHQLGCGA